MLINQYVNMSDVWRGFQGVIRLYWPTNTERQPAMFNHEMILDHIDDRFGHDMHAKRAYWPTPPQVIESGSLAIHAIGNDFSLANGLERNHAVTSNIATLRATLGHQDPFT